MNLVFLNLLPSFVGKRSFYSLDQILFLPHLIKHRFLSSRSAGCEPGIAGPGHSSLVPWWGTFLTGERGVGGPGIPHLPLPVPPSHSEPDPETRANGDAPAPRRQCGGTGPGLSLLTSNGRRRSEARGSEGGGRAARVPRGSRPSAPANGLRPQRPSTRTGGPGGLGTIPSQTGTGAGEGVR